MANYFDHLLSLDTPTYTVAQIAKRFEPSTVLWAFHTIQPSSLILTLSKDDQLSKFIHRQEEVMTMQ